MRALRKEEENGSLTGLRILNAKSVLHELFADDTSFFIRARASDFQKARSTIEKFKQASGALLNVQKSMIMALGLNSKGIARVNRAIRNFLWGFSAEGKPKVALIAYARWFKQLHWEKVKQHVK
ncbi:hypothetical protein R1sor_001159 [Riccia sorocarpa]|uniref:Reverse transcriptase domain-containing protein n=1 Tax=Riccia sorocarpa TaxID=122646 RepID=A0ABD3GYB5_9MARC